MTCSIRKHHITESEFLASDRTDMHWSLALTWLKQVVVNSALLIIFFSFALFFERKSRKMLASCTPRMRIYIPTAMDIIWLVDGLEKKNLTVIFAPVIEGNLVEHLLCNTVQHVIKLIMYYTKVFMRLMCSFNYSLGSFTDIPSSDKPLRALPDAQQSGSLQQKTNLQGFIHERFICENPWLWSKLQASFLDTFSSQCKNVFFLVSTFKHCV